MHQFRTIVAVILLALLTSVRSVSAAEADAGAILRRMIDAAGEAGALRAASGRGFLVSDLRAAAAPAWNAGIAAGDPLPVIGSLHDRLHTAGITLVVVPVPNRVLLHAEELDPALATADLAANHRAALAALAARGVAVVDLLEPFRALARDGADPSCRLDSHWSPAAAERAAEVVAERISAQPWHGAIERRRATTATVALQAHGDLATLLGLGEEVSELLTLHKVTWDPASVERQSPVLVIGDSHALVYSRPIAGGIAARGAGFVDHLGLRLGLAIDNAANQGDGVNQTRAVVARRPPGWQGRIRCVVWLFASRAFTRAADGWHDIALFP